MNLRELVMGDKSRSCGQWDIWEAVFGPKASDGFPERIWDKRTGEINATTAKYWKEHFDLAYILKANAAKLTPLLRNKLHVYVGAGDTYFLTNAVMDLQDYFTTNGTLYNASVC